MSDAPRFLPTEQVGQGGRTEYWLFEYDLDRPRNLDAEDPRARYGVKRMVGIYPTRAKLEAALSRAQGEARASTGTPDEP